MSFLITFFLYGSTALWTLAAFSVLNPIQGRTPWTGNQPVTGQHKHCINAQTSMSQVGFEPTFILFKQEKTVHILVRMAIMIRLI
jgi:hypothetical protein